MKKLLLISFIALFFGVKAQEQGCELRSVGYIHSYYWGGNPFNLDETDSLFVGDSARLQLGLSFQSCNRINETIKMYYNQPNSSSVLYSGFVFEFDSLSIREQQICGAYQLNGKTQYFFCQDDKFGYVDLLVTFKLPDVAGLYEINDIFGNQRRFYRVYEKTVTGISTAKNPENITKQQVYTMQGELIKDTTEGEVSQGLSTGQLYILINTYSDNSVSREKLFVY